MPDTVREKNSEEHIVLKQNSEQENFRSGCTALKKENFFIIENFETLSVV